jgi:ATP/maltotriose-dependent transcriptional regulator MalT/DNA-binding SARP family transcriptional activator
LTLPDLPLMVARSQVSGLGFKDLAFRAKEIQALVQQNYQQPMPDSVAKELVQETEGWITGLLLSAQTMWQGMADRVRLARVSGVGLYDYLAQQVLNQQSAPVRDFLLRTSLLEEFDVQLCQAVLGSDQDWQSLMNAVLQSNLFVLPVDKGGTWLRYHHLFRDFLQAQLAQERPAELERILHSLASFYKERREWEKAYSIYQRLGDTAETANLIELAGSSMVKNGRVSSLAQWIEALPVDVQDSRPALLSLSGTVAVVQGETERGLKLLSEAQADFQNAGNTAQLARTLVRRAVAHRFLGQHQASLNDANGALALSKKDKGLRAVYAEALRAKGLSLHRVGQPNAAVDCLSQSLEIYQRIRDEQNVAMLNMELGMVYRALGDNDSAKSCYDNALDYWRKVDDIARQANLLNNLGVLYHLEGDYERAGTLLEEGLECARRSRYLRIQAFTLSSIGDLYADLDAPQAATDAYRQAQEIAREIDQQFLLLYIDLALATLARSTEQFDLALDLLESTRQLIEDRDSALEKGIWRREMGRLQLANQNAPAAISHLEQAVRLFEEGDQRIEEACVHFYLAEAYQMIQDNSASVTHLQKALKLATNLGSQHTLVIAGRENRALLEAAQSDPVIGTQISQLVERINQFERDIPVFRRRLRRQASAVPFAPPKLNFQALGNIQVKVDERPLSGADWQAQVARDLVFCLLAHPQGLTKDAIGGIFWPDSSPDQLKLQFKKTMYRLRRALGQDVVLFDQERYRFNRVLDFEYDVDLFLKSIEEAQAATDPVARVAGYCRAVKLYKGPYLPEMDGTWVWPERERLWQLYVETTLALAEFHLESAEYGEALEYCRHVLTQDPCLEAAHRVAMRTHAAMGNRVGVARQFESCRQILLEEINVPPSPQTEALYTKLMQL